METDGSPTEAEGEEAARKAASSDRLMPNEEASMRSGDLDDAIHWLSVYEELFDFKQQMLETVGRQREDADPDGLDELENDILLLTREADRLARRVDYWRRETAIRLPR